MSVTGIEVTTHEVSRNLQTEPKRVPELTSSIIAISSFVFYSFVSHFSRRRRIEDGEVEVPIVCSGGCSNPGFTRSPVLLSQRHSAIRRLWHRIR